MTKNSPSFSRLLHPDFSGYVRDGVFDAHDALTTHLLACDFLLRTCLALSAFYVDPLPGFDCQEDRLFVIESTLSTYREAVEAGVVECNRVKLENPQGLPDRGAGAPRLVR
jgi:hypothetical protein